MPFLAVVARVHPGGFPCQPIGGAESAGPTELVLTTSGSGAAEPTCTDKGCFAGFVPGDSCQCDPSCYHNGDCCADFDLVCAPTTASTTATTTVTTTETTTTPTHSPSMSPSMSPSTSPSKPPSMSPSMSPTVKRCAFDGRTDNPEKCVTSDGSSMSTDYCSNSLLGPELRLNCPILCNSCLTSEPTMTPTQSPSYTSEPTMTPTQSPTVVPTNSPTDAAECNCNTDGSG